ncbi:hypothetical protein ThvES_00005160 [Thiovulum sp. ES]|nr:hypothetical protein ThvES_00005160 [Thiovulum sp. ES]
MIIGSTKSEVLEIMGNPTGHNWKGEPTHRFSTEWYYGDKIVEFNHSGIIVTVGLCN